MSNRKHHPQAITMTDAQMATLIAMSEQIGEGMRTPLFRPVSKGESALAIGSYGARIPGHVLKSERPTTILLTDDHPDALGVKGWPQVRRLLRWARLAVLHATGGQAEHYAFVASATRTMQRVLVIEMEHRHHAEWLALAEQYVPRLKILNIVPPAGGTHPVAGVPAGVVLQ